MTAREGRDSHGPGSSLLGISEIAYCTRQDPTRVGLEISSQALREFFACEMGRLGVPDRYVDAFCGRVPQSF
jgi:hypothetical protein